MRSLENWFPKNCGIKSRLELASLPSSPSPKQTKKIINPGHWVHPTHWDLRYLVSATLGCGNSSYHLILPLELLLELLLEPLPELLPELLLEGAVCPRLSCVTRTCSGGLCDLFFLLF